VCRDRLQILQPSSEVWFLVYYSNKNNRKETKKSPAIEAGLAILTQLFILTYSF
jgi:hypothetical protein